MAKIINPAIIVVILNPSPVTLSETKGLVVQLRTGSVKDLVTAWKGEILRIAQNDIIAVFTCRFNSKK